MGADGVGREAEAAGDVRDGEAVEVVATDPAMVLIKESPQQAQATTASRRSTRGMAQVTAMARVLMRNRTPLQVRRVDGTRSFIAWQRVGRADAARPEAERSGDSVHPKRPAEERARRPGPVADRKSVV